MSVGVASQVSYALLVLGFAFMAYAERQSGLNWWSVLALIVSVMSLLRIVFPVNAP